jgi:hypothetical protein
MIWQSVSGVRRPTQCILFPTLIDLHTTIKRLTPLDVSRNADFSLHPSLQPIAVFAGGT